MTAFFIRHCMNHADRTEWRVFSITVSPHSLLACISTSAGLPPSIPDLKWLCGREYDRLFGTLPWQDIGEPRRQAKAFRTELLPDHDPGMTLAYAFTCE